MPSDENQLFWKAYASTIKDMINSGPIGDNVRVYVAPPNTAGISGGRKIPQEVTNWGIYQFGDYLLDPTNPNWISSKVGQYSESLNNTLQTLKLGPGGDTSPQAFDQLNNAKEKLANRKKELDAAKAEAKADFKDDDNPRKATTFSQWSQLNAPAYLTAYKNWEAATNEVEMRTGAIGGSGSALLKDAMMKVAAGQNYLTEVPGFNMTATIAPINFDADGQPIVPSPLNTQLVPQYSISGYSSLLDGWTQNENQKASEFTINLSTGQERSYKELGFTEAQGDASFSRFPVISFYGQGGGRTDTSNFNMSRDAKDVTVTLRVKHYKTISFEPGSWNVNVNDLVTKLGAQQPQLSTKVRSTNGLFAQGVSMDVQFKGDAKTAFEADYKRVINGGGGVSIFGFRIGASGSSSEETQTRGGTWDSSSGVLSVQAEDARMTANVLAIMGEVVTV